MTLPSRVGGNGIVVLDDQAPSRAGVVRFAGASHPGLVRERNEDRLHIDAARGLLIVVDGIGGAAAGEVAAEAALARLLERLERPGGSPEQRVREAIASANNEVARLGRENPAWNGMGCVLTLALIEQGVVTVGHVGDSRLYRLRAGRLEKVTHDHSPIGMREDQGEISERDAMGHPRRNEVFRSLGSERHAPFDDDFIEVLRFPLPREEAILVCSDGLTDLVPSSEIARVIREHADHERTLVQRLVDAANAAGGKDNVTVAIAAGDRFAQEFPRASRTCARTSATSSARAELQAGGRGGLWSRRSSFFVLGALVGLAIFAGIRLLEDRQRAARAHSASHPAPIGVRLDVGPDSRFRTIGDALAAARAGDTVVVHPGRYREQVRLEQGVTLMAAEPRRAVIEPPVAQDLAGPVAAVVAEDLGAGRVSGLAIASGSGAPIDYGVVIRRSTITLENLDVRGARVAGVAIEDAGGSALIACRVHDNAGAGIVVRGAGTPLVLHNRVLDNGRGRPPAAGIEVTAPAAPRIEGNVIAGNGAEGVRGLAPTPALLDANLFEASGRSNGLGPARAATRGSRR